MYLWSKVESSWNSSYISSRHAASDLLAELSNVRTGGVQVLQKNCEARALLSCSQECPQASYLHHHTVQGTLGELEVIG